MSEQTIEVVRHFSEALWDRRDFEAARQLADNKLELDWSESKAPYAGKVRGFEAAIRWFTDVAEAFVGYGVERRSFTGCGPALVAVEQSISGRERDSGIEVKATGTILWRVRDGKVVSGKLFQTRAEALEAAGLSE